MTITTTRTFCRFCHAACPIEVDVDDGDQIVGVRGDAADPIFGALHVHQGPPPRRPAPPPRAAAHGVAPTSRSVGVRRDPDGAGAGRDRRADAGDPRRRRPAGDRQLLRDGDVPERRRPPGRPGVPQGDRLAVVLHVDHDRPAGEDGHAAAPRVVGRRAAAVVDGRRVARRRHQHRRVDARHPRRPDVRQPAGLAAGGQAAWPAAHRDRPAAHRDGGDGRPPPAGQAGRGPDVAGRDAAGDPRRGPGGRRVLRPLGRRAGRAPPRPARLRPRPRRRADRGAGRRHRPRRPHVRRGPAGVGHVRHRSEHGAARHA